MEGSEGSLLISLSLRITSRSSGPSSVRESYWRTCGSAPQMSAVGHLLAAHHHPGVRLLPSVCLSAFIVHQLCGQTPSRRITKIYRL